VDSTGQGLRSDRAATTGAEDAEMHTVHPIRPTIPFLQPFHVRPLSQKTASGRDRFRARSAVAELSASGQDLTPTTLAFAATTSITGDHIRLYDYSAPRSRATTSGSTITVHSPSGVKGALARSFRLAQHTACTHLYDPRPPSLTHLRRATSQSSASIPTLLPQPCIAKGARHEWAAPRRRTARLPPTLKTIE
jgi:hypothetical protein